MGVAILGMAVGIAAAQAPVAATPAPESTMSTPNGYTSHHSIDIGGRMSDQVGSGAMYNTLVNLKAGPRVQGENFELHALPGNKKSLVDDLSAFGTGFGGDPNVIAKLDASKGKYYEFSGIFRRDRLYSNYNLLANPNVPTSGLLVDIGPSTAPSSQLNWSQMSRAKDTSPVMFNTVRRMTDTNLTLNPFGVLTYRFAYSHGTMEGPTLSPAYTPLGMKNNALLEQYERNGSDDFLGAIDWKPSQATKITLEVQANHYKSDTFYTLDPSGFVVQEADGTPAYLGNYTAFAPYGAAMCNTASMGTGNYTSASNYTMLSPANTPGGLPIINPACAVVTQTMRTAPTRIWTPTETLRLQSSAIKNVVMNGNVYYNAGTSDMPNWTESAQGLNGTVRSAISTGGYATSRRAVFGIDYGFVWQATPSVSITDQVDYSSVKQPGHAYIPVPTTLNTPALTTGNATINYPGTLTPGVGTLPHGNTGLLAYNFYGQGTVSNTATLAWDASSSARFSLAYRYTSRNIGQGVPRNQPVLNIAITGVGVTCDPYCGYVKINQNAGIFNASLHPAKNWNLSGSAEISYDDNALTPVDPRQAQIYRVHSVYRANKLTSLSMSYSDRERHNNTNNAQDEVKAGGAAYNGTLNHVDYSRVGSLGVVITPSERLSVDLNYTYSDVYTATNTCFTNGTAAASTTVTPNVPAVPGAATVTSTGAPALCTSNAEFKGRDFEDAPTNFVSAILSYAASDKLQLNAGYTISKVDGTRFFPDSRDVNGMLSSKFQTPTLNVAYTMHPGLIWKADYNYYGYGEGGPSGAQLCTTTPTSASITAANIVPCSSLANTAMSGPSYGSETPRTFHANNITLGIHYEF